MATTGITLIQLVKRYGWMSIPRREMQKCPCPKCSKKGLAYAGHAHAYGHKDKSKIYCRFCHALLGEKKRKSYSVWGHAFVPVKVRLTIEATSSEHAMKLANEQLKKGGIRKHIEANTEDHDAAWGFDALDAEEVKNENEEKI